VSIPQSLQRDPVVRPGDHADRHPIGWAQDLQAVIGAAVHGADEPRRSVVIAANGKSILATGRQGKQSVAGRGWPGPPPRPPVARIYRDDSPPDAVKGGNSQYARRRPARVAPDSGLRRCHSLQAAGPDHHVVPGREAVLSL